MQDTRTAQSLKDVAKIRALQRVAAEGRAAQAVTALRDSEARCGEAEKRSVAVERDWQRIVSEPAMAMDLMPSYSAALLHQEAMVVEARGDRLDAQARVDDHRMQWREAAARENLASDMARSALRDWHRRKEDRLVQDMADRFAARAHRR